jgi:MarR family transcriptional regulator for hemolysin
MLAQLGKLRAQITQTALNHLTAAEADALVEQLESIKDNVRDALQAVSDAKSKEPRYG